jgi:hypothetical protein
VSGSRIAVITHVFYDEATETVSDKDKRAILLVGSEVVDTTNEGLATFVETSVRGINVPS